MDVQRVILLSALALVTYLVFLQWNQDYNQPTAAPQVAFAPDVINGSPANGASDLPTGSVSSDDIPAAVDPSAPAVIETAQTSAAQVRVRTDVLDLVIDTRGGDIIYAALPQHKARLGSDDPFVLLEQNAMRTYVAQSGLVGRDGPDASADGRPVFRADASEFSLDDQANLVVDLHYTTDAGVDIIKRYTFERGSYRIGVDYLIDNQSDAPFRATLFGQLKRDRSEDPTSSTSVGMASYLGAIFSTEDNKYQKVTFRDMDRGNFAQTSLGGWAAFSQHYFVSAWVPDPNQTHNFQTRRVNNEYIAGFLSPAVEVVPGSSTEVSAHLFVGPKDQEQLEATAPNLKLTVDYGWLWWIAYPLYWLLTFIQSFVGNWGLAIIGITIVVKAALFQLNAKAFRSMAKMRKFGPEMMRMKELYGDDRQKMSQEMMKLYKKEKINPLGGCLPILAQMPVFIALYWVLMESVELRHAPFFLYIQDLSVMDPYFVLPILMGVTMFLQQKLNPTPPDPMQAKIMKMLPIIFTFFFLWFPAGLVLYWLVNNILSIAQQWYITRQIENEDKKKEAS
ncbi:Inner membrane protein translocase component YidC, long form [Nitrincola lacisaponensis]|uniref:Membrane protein insertase YidC n=1 Tax=Nitrincola lacisaponensis TaxID=267850 RepID=A0A063Y9N5_9GAMM|nr:membrane protein insertase YidC [Nitrincola lacisaponensis]KDE41411.1 Inner membrane protein translocase component YidC, long form [Nitrincola lacisaponensis]